MRVVLLLVVFTVASVRDWKVREVRDELWQLGGLGGAALLLYTGLGSSPWFLGLDVLVALFVLQHVLPWDARLADRPGTVLALEGALYAVVIGVTAWAYLFVSPAPNDELFGVVAGVVMSRALFESGFLYGGADAKALMVASLILPVDPAPLLLSLPSPVEGTLLSALPFAFTVLVDGALATLVVPLFILAYNLSRGEHRFPRILHLYRIPTEELPRRYVWLKDPAPSTNVRAESTEEDDQLRRDQARELLNAGVKQVWVTPQLPFLISLTAGAVLALVAGNLLLQLLSAFP